jgi:phosphate acetyltransferase
LSLLEIDAPVVRNTHAKLRELIKVAQTHPPVKVAVAHTCDDASLEGVVEAARLRLIQPILVGPEQRIRSVAAEHDLDITSFELVDANYSNESAAKAVELVREGRAEALMKGSLHTDELMAEVV